jgi:hypothetical protein
MHPSAVFLASMLASRLGDASRAWLDAARQGAQQGESMLTAFAAVPRQAGRGALAPTADEHRQIAVATSGLDVTPWTRADAVRTVLLATLAASVEADRFEEAFTGVFEAADTGEQQSCLRALVLLPAPERFLPLAVDACRTNIVPLFESIACDTPYPQRYFPEGQFNQLVIKALFLGVPLVRIVGLQDRRNPELARIASDFAAERRAAGRPTPPDLDLALAARSPAESLR